MSVAEEKTQEKRAYAYGRDHEFTKEEYDELMGEIKAAIKRKDNETVNRLVPRLPMDANVLMAFGSVYGRGFILEADFDLTQANMKFGEGWINDLKP